ncbi:MAG: hypothetical protein JEZ03_09770 [Bacteroidales bacterium]|nr:hypothetical protein [Bacteroidales bacterium]
MKKVLIIIGVLVLALFIWLIYSGLFTNAQIKQEKAGGYWLVYEEFVGDYSNAGKITDKVYNELKEMGIETTKGFGIYMDNPQEIAREKCRSELGCILEPNDLDKLSQIKAKFKVKNFIKQDCITSEFPFKNKMSIMFGIFKVYPKMNEYMEANNIPQGPIMEVYDMPNKKIYYLKALNESSTEVVKPNSTL